MSVREERKQQTRQILLDTALRLAGEHGGFAAISIREVTREAGLVPTAFYRHFPGLEELGLTLVDDACLSLHMLLRDIQADLDAAGSASIKMCVSAYFNLVRQDIPAFLFLLRERHGASSIVRDAIDIEIRSFSAGLAKILSNISYLRDFPSDDLEILADLIVTTVMALDPGMFKKPFRQGRQKLTSDLRVLKQLRMVLLGAGQWQSK